MSLNWRDFRSKGAAYYFDLVLIFSVKEIKIRYKNSFLGYFWSISNPLAQTLIFYFAFEIVLKSGIPDYVAFLIVGLFAWQWFSNYLLGACNTFIANGQLIKKAIFPRFVLPIALNMQDLFHFAMSVPIIVAMLVWYRLPLSWVLIPGFLIITVAQFMLLLGLGLAVASINIFFRDLERILAILLNVCFYFSAVLFPIDRVPEAYRPLLYINPMTSLISAWRALFLDDRLAWSPIALAYGFAALALVMGSLVYRRLSPRFAEVL